MKPRRLNATGLFVFSRGSSPVTELTPGYFLPRERSTEGWANIAVR